MGLVKKSVKVDERSVQLLFGQFDKNIRKIEKTFGISYIYRNDELSIEGEEASVDKALNVINDLLVISRKGNDLTDQNVDYAISITTSGEGGKVSDLEGDDELICHTLAGRPIRPKTFGQKKYVEAIDDLRYGR